MKKTPTTDLERPARIRSADGQRRDGRPAEPDDPDTMTAPEAPTVAPEEEGKTPTTEHAPGADL